MVSSDLFRHLNAQEANGVESVITEVFDAMRNNDEEKLQSLFYSDMTMKIVDHQNGKSTLETSSAEQFVRAVGQPKDEIWDEQFDELEIIVDGHFATAVMDYGFYRGDRFSHCGKNVFSLIQTGSEWKIFSIIYSRRTNNCEKWIH